MHYHNLMALLFEPSVATSLDGLDGKTAGDEATPAAIVSHSKACHETLFRLFYLRHGFDDWDSTLIHYSAMAAFTAISRFKAMLSPAPTTKQSQSATPQGVDRRSRDEALSSLMLCAQGLREHARYSLLSEVIFRSIRHSLAPSDLDMLRDHGVDLEPRESEQTLATYVRSLYPVGIVSVVDDPQAKRMDAIVRSYRRLEVSPQEDCPSPASSSTESL